MRRDWETSPERVGFLIQLLAWIVGTFLYAAVAYIMMAITPAEFRLEVGVGLVALYFLLGAIFALSVLRSWRGRRYLG